MSADQTTSHPGGIQAKGTVEEAGVPVRFWLPAESVGGDDGPSSQIGLIVKVPAIKMRTPVVSSR
jgi:hypothetical protein